MTKYAIKVFETEIKYESTSYKQLNTYQKETLLINSSIPVRKKQFVQTAQYLSERNTSYKQLNTCQKETLRTNSSIPVRKKHFV